MAGLLHDAADGAQSLHEADEEGALASNAVRRGCTISAQDAAGDRNAAVLWLVVAWAISVDLFNMRPS
ncbi:MAG: hypothetical protein R3C16_00065 [Hyphomonadaceae bacterium]